MRYRDNHSVYAVVFVCLLLATVAHANVATIPITVQVSVCGNNIVETGEECDTAQLAGASCRSVGFSSGTLTCGSDCSFRTNQCVHQSFIGGGGIGQLLVEPLATQLPLVSWLPMNIASAIPIAPVVGSTSHSIVLQPKNRLFEIPTLIFQRLGAMNYLELGLRPHPYGMLMLLIMFAAIVYSIIKAFLSSKR